MNTRLFGAIALELTLMVMAASGYAQAPAPNISSLSLTQGPVNMGFVINGTNFGAVQGSSTVALNGATLPVISWAGNGTSITVQIPSGASTGNVIVRVAGVSSNAKAFTVSAPFGCG